jgi:hypothetical protein
MKNFPQWSTEYRTTSFGTISKWDNRREVWLVNVGEYETRSFMICASHQKQSVGQLKKNKIRWACSTYGGTYILLLGKPDGFMDAKHLEN